jgi:hypothetical protein
MAKARAQNGLRSHHGRRLMPVPGLPDWFGPGAVIVEQSTPDPRTFVVTRVELQFPSVAADEGDALSNIFQEHVALLGGAYAATIVALNTHSLPIHLDMTQRIVGNVSVILASYSFLGVYYQGNGTLIPAEERPNLSRALSRLQNLAGPDDDDDIPPDLDDDILPDADYATWEQVPTTPTIVAVGRDGDEVRAVPERDVPIVGPEQVWALPPPNEGLWRTTVAILGNRRGSIRLTHTREADRRMDTTASWLVEHGVRQDPPDPRSRGGEIVLGQIWEIPSEALHRYKDIRRWRVTAVDAARVTLRSADNGSKRLWWDHRRLLRLGTCLGDGLPRRTAFQRLLEDDE